MKVDQKIDGKGDLPGLSFFRNAGLLHWSGR
jgi:hypothetical protein